MTPRRSSRTRSRLPRFAVDLAEGEAANDERQGLGAADASLSGDDGQEGREDDQLFDGGLKEADYKGGEDGGAEVDVEPGKTAGDGASEGVEEAVLSKAGDAIHVLGVLLSENVDQVFHQYQANQGVVFFDDGQVVQVVSVD